MYDIFSMHVCFGPISTPLDNKYSLMQKVYRGKILIGFPGQSCLALVYRHQKQKIFLLHPLCSLPTWTDITSTNSLYTTPSFRDYLVWNFICLISYKMFWFHVNQEVERSRHLTTTKTFFRNFVKSWFLSSLHLYYHPPPHPTNQPLAPSLPGSYHQVCSLSAPNISIFRSQTLWQLRKAKYCEVRERKRERGRRSQCGSRTKCCQSFNTLDRSL